MQPPILAAAPESTGSHAFTEDAQVLPPLLVETSSR